MSKTLECSTAGDSRFSAFKAHVLFHGEYDTIENFYQKCKRDENNKIPGKGRPVHHVYWYGKTYPAEALSVIYEELWRLYFKQRPYLLDYAKEFDNFTDRFKGKAINCQADVIAKLVKEMEGTEREYINTHINSLWAISNDDIEKYTYVITIPKFKTLSDCLRQLAKILKFIKRGGKAVSYKGVELTRKNVLWMAKLYHDTLDGLGEQGIVSAVREEDLWDYKLFYTNIKYSYDIREYDNTYFSAGIIGVEEVDRNYLQPDLDFTITVGIIPELIDLFRKPRVYTNKFIGKTEYKSIVDQYKTLRFVDLAGSIKDGYKIVKKEKSTIEPIKESEERIFTINLLKICGMDESLVDEKEIIDIIKPNFIEFIDTTLSYNYLSNIELWSTHKRILEQYLEYLVSEGRMNVIEDARTYNNRVTDEESCVYEEDYDALEIIDDTHHMCEENIYDDIFSIAIIALFGEILEEESE